MDFQVEVINIFVLISQKRTDTLKALLNKHQIDISYIKENDINSYFMRNMNRMEHISHLIIDLYALLDTDNELIKTVETINRVYSDMHIIVLADMVGNRERNFFLRLIENEVYNIIKTPIDSSEQFEADFFKCIHEGRTKDYALSLINMQEMESDTKSHIEQSEKTRQTGEEIVSSVAEKVSDIKALQTSSIKEQNKLFRKRLSPNRSFKEYKDYLIVSVAGVNSHVGTTHNALLITKFLKDIGFKACYLENGTDNKIFSLKSYIPSINYNKRINQMQLNRIDLYAGVSVNELLSYEYDIYVVDVGVLSNETLMSFLYKDIHILVCGAKSWEISDLPVAINLIKSKNTCDILLNFSIKEDEDKIMSMLGDFKKQAYFTEYVPNFLESDVNVVAYQAIFEKYLTVDEPMSDKPVVVKRKLEFMNLLNRK